MPVLTAVAHIIDNELTPKKAVYELMNLPQLNLKIKALIQQGHYSEALESYTREPQSPLIATKFTFPSLLKACASLSNSCYGKIIHATIIQTGLQFDPFVAASLINMYVKCGSLENAVQLFENVSDGEELARDVTFRNSMIDGYFKYGLVDEGIAQLRRMQPLGVKPDGYSLCILLRVCDAILGSLEGKQIHGYIVRNLRDGDPFVVTALIDMYSNCGRPMDALRVFENSTDRNNIVVWNAIIGGLSEDGFWEHSLELYSFAKDEDCRLVSTTFSGVLTACSLGEDVKFGRRVHCDVIKMGFQNDPYVCTSLLTMYGKSRYVEDAKKVFDSVLDKEIALWNALISAYICNGCAYDALDVYTQMSLREIPFDSFTISNLLVTCTMSGLYDLGRTLHGELIKRSIDSNVAVQSALLTMYSKCGHVEDANVLFGTMKGKDLVAWGSMISGFCQNRKFKEALDLFRTMQVDGLKPDSDIMASIINSCEGLECIEMGWVVHGLVIKSGFGLDSFVSSSLIDMYSNYGSVEMAANVFFHLLQKNLVVWNSMISCYCQNGLPGLSICLLPQIVQHSLRPDIVSITSVLVAVSSMAALLKGKTIHGYQIRLEISADIQVENAFIDMYIKCGCLKYAHYIFQNMPRRNLVSWNSMIAGFGSHGECLKAINLFDEMRGSDIKPDDVTFLSLISSCNHSGLIEEGLYLFQLMKVYRIEPGMEHYVNVVDLLGRAGCLSDAYSVIQSMPIEPDRTVWLSLLSACRVHHNIELGELAAHDLLKMDPARGSNYAQVLNLYEEAGLRDRAANLRASMRQKGLKKNPGCSWIEVGNKVDIFFSRDSSPQGQSRSMIHSAVFGATCKGEEVIMKILRHSETHKNEEFVSSIQAKRLVSLASLMIFIRIIRLYTSDIHTLLKW
ncbi:unnamed protein product [Ilex paraguariensis]|uniref:Chlororespiratory reduction 21 n=1 Tax=Ilex paraguariensis TaxID=185542 RepID=A0ABC8SKX0_9AQUA